MTTIFRLVLAAVFVLIPLVSCGDPTDDPEDCTENEYFDESKSLCRTCDPISEPDCGEGCGFTVVSDSNGCALAECNLECTGACAFGQFFSDESLQCEACPGFDAGPSSCDELGCECTLVEQSGICLPRVCGQCRNPDQGWAVTDAGLCVPNP